MLINISGEIDFKLEKEIEKELNWNLSIENRICLFVMHSDCNISLGSEIIALYSKNETNKRIEVKGKLISVTQQYLKEFKEIPIGWKVIALFEFENELPKLLRELPRIESWYDRKGDYICFVMKN